MAGLRATLSLSALLAATGVLAMPAPKASAVSPDASVWYQPPARATQPTRHVSQSHRSSGVRISYGSGYFRSNTYCPTYGYSGYSSSRYRFGTPVYHHPSYSRVHRPTVISYPSTSTRITYVNPVVQETRYVTQAPPPAYDAVSYREYQRLLAEQRILRQQVIDLERQRSEAAQPTYNPGPPVPSTAPLNQIKGTGDSLVKPDRTRSADEILPPLPRESRVQSDSGLPAGNDTMPQAWRSLADGNFPDAMGFFTNLAGQETASTADRVGFALAAASVGQRERAAWAMRRVLIADPEGFGFIPGSAELTTVLKRLSSDIGRDADARSEGPERRMLMFLAASIDYLALDMEKSAERLSQATPDGTDSHAGIVNLRRLLAESGSGGF